MRVFRQLRQQLAEPLYAEAPFMVLAVGLSLLQAALTLLTPWFAGLFAGQLLGVQTGSGMSVSLLLVIWAVALLAQALARFASSFFLTRGGARVLATLSRRLHEHLLALPLAFFESRKRGDLLALHSNDVAAIAHFATGVVAGLVPAVAVLLGSLFMMGRIEPTVAVLVALVTPVFFLTIKLLGRRLRPLSESVAAQQANALALADEQLSLMPLIKGFNRGAGAADQFGARVTQLFALRADQLRIQALLAPALQLLSSLGVLVVLWLSAAHLQGGRLDVVQFVSLLMYGLLFTRPVSGLANLYGETLQARGAALRLERIFAEHREAEAASDTSLDPGAGDISISRLSFGYPEHSLLFKNLELAVDAGEIVAITGANGAGKSTLLHLLMRFYEPQSGAIRIGAQSIRDVSLGSLRTQVALVTQDVLLVDGSIADNIRYGMPQASTAKVRNAARLAQADEFIQRLPETYETPVGEGGVALSGGEKQRIALARALLMHPQVLLLDEAMAMFDTQGEDNFVAQSATAFAGRTVILVTHRPASLALADRVLRLQDGVLKELENGFEPKVRAV
jgi:ATP-binding cassette subfamily B protein